MEKYINPYTDFGFKKLFGSTVNKDLLIDFLNELIQDQGKITDIQYLKSEQLGVGMYDRKAVFDIYCENERGEKFIVEMQKAKQSFFKDRSVFYSTFPIREQAESGGQWNFELKAVYLIGILDFVFSDNKSDKDFFHHEVQLMDKHKKEVFYDKLTFIYLEMPKFNKTEDELLTHFDKWMYVLKNLGKFQQRPAKLQERIFEKLFKEAEIAHFTKEENDAYEDSLKTYRDMHNVLDTALADGEAKGRAEGRAEGEKKKETEIILKLLSSGMEARQISLMLDISEEEILQIKKQ